MDYGEFKLLHDALGVGGGVVGGGGAVWDLPYPVHADDAAGVPDRRCHLGIINATCAVNATSYIKQDIAAGVPDIACVCSILLKYFMYSTYYFVCNIVHNIGYRTGHGKCTAGRPALPRGASCAPTIGRRCRRADPSRRSEPAIRVSDLSPRRRLICGNGGRGVASAAAGFAASIRVRAARTGRRGAR